MRAMGLPSPSWKPFQNSSCSPKQGEEVVGRLASFEAWAELVPERSTGSFIYRSGPKGSKVLELTQEPALQCHCDNSRWPGLQGWGGGRRTVGRDIFLLPGHLHLPWLDPDTFSLRNQQ